MSPEERRHIEKERRAATTRLYIKAMERGARQGMYDFLEKQKATFGGWIFVTLFGAFIVGIVTWVLKKYNITLADFFQ